MRISILLGWVACLSLCSPALAAPLESVYTDISSGKCKKIKEDVEYEEEKCPGVGGYVLHSIYSDQRQSITLLNPQGKEFPLNLWEVISPGFSSLGDKAEWRVEKSAGKVIPKALIVRFNVTENAGESPKKTSYLIVSKISSDGICTTEKIPPHANANEQARAAADSSQNKPCLKASR